MRFLVSQVLRYSGASRRIVIRKRGFLLRFYPTNALAQQWVDPYHLHDVWHGHREETFFRRYLRPGDVVVDVGANFGLTALAAFSAVGPTGQVHAFEPHPRVFGYLLGNIELNGAEAVVTARRLAIGDRSGDAFLTDYRVDDQNTISGTETGVRVPAATLDEALPDLPRIALLKIDVEGYEKFVLEGATRTLERVDCVYFESYLPNFAQHGYRLDDVLALLRARGFQVLRPDGDGPGTPVAAGHDSAEPEDLVAVRDPDHLRRRLEG